MKKCQAPGRYRVLITFLIIVLLPISLPLHTSARENAGNIWPETSRTIPAGETSGVITVKINEDRLIEGHENFFLLLDRPVNATISDNQGMGTIADNERL